MKEFSKENLKKLFKPAEKSNGEDNGQVTIIGGSSLFHGAPILALKTASRIVDMVFFASPEKNVGMVAESAKSKLMSFIWIPWEDIEAYIEKSDAVLIGPGMMRYGHESGIMNYELRGTELDEEGEKTRGTTEKLLMKFPNKKWVIDAGSLQTMDADWIPKNAIITPNKKEFEILFKVKIQNSELKTISKNPKLLKIVQVTAAKHDCVIVLKGPETLLVSKDEMCIVRGGNAGLTKGGTGDVLAGLTVALLAKNDPFLAACSASYIEKSAADVLYKTKGTYYNADDLADYIPSHLASVL